MKKIIFIFAIAITATSCNKVERTFDSEIGAIRDQTEVLKEQNKLIAEQNKILSEIAQKMQK